MHAFTKDLITELHKKANVNIAIEQSNYMRNEFQFFGIKTPLRRDIQKPFFKLSELPPKSEMLQIVRSLWIQPQRECQYSAQEFAYRYLKHSKKNDIELYIYMATHKSWWDTIDFIAIKLIGHYFKVYPELRKTYINDWISSKNLWLQRCALLFQIKYKNNLDTTLLEHVIAHLSHTQEFFIDKAIGWVLREYSKTNAKWVRNFVSKTDLSVLSQKEALRLID